ncbi:NAD(P)H-hydrate dehydratase [Flavobacterium crassostreae]|uniref:ADP-dependent (S)-NAD(P)H-hydrate dehydratase n=1 Tax=Flavobacterium crassostreae TaxID=1763534 RepID=A0A1B9E9K8_9FLAO|nr:NAD(P)H-hydrate dehydratase [Flavobacterium crassostreae]OCB78647.1 NAD(P)H-hydrate dehydratase [Flavobacterium crassostreae]
MKQAVVLDKAEIVKRYKPIDPQTHKGMQGHALIIAGSYGKMGAAVLASKSCLKTGCGLVTALVPKCGYEILQIANPEVMTLTDKKEQYLSDIKMAIKPQAIAIGPGLGQHIVTQKAVLDFLKTNRIPLVLDADALNILACNKAWFSVLLPKTILTPHPKELERLLGEWHTEEEKFQKTRAFVCQYDLIVVMKGAPTYIFTPDAVYVNTTGNAALATAGSGDVLTGMLTSLLAQGYSATDAALLGVYLHGLTATIALPKTGYQSFTATTILKNIGKAFLSLENQL